MTTSTGPAAGEQVMEQVTRRGTGQNAAAAGPGTATLAGVLGLLAVLAAACAALGIGVRGTDGGQAAVDEPQYLLSALSLAEDHDLDISDELADRRAQPFHQARLPVQTEVRADGSQLSPHDPLLPLLLAPAVGVGGWVAAKAVLAGLAGALAALTCWVAVRRLRAPLGIAAAVVGCAAASAPLAVFGQQVYPELPAALAVVTAVAALTGRLGTGGLLGLLLAVVALPWLSVKYAPVAAVLALLGLVALWRAGRRATAATTAGLLAAAGVAFLAVHRAVYGGWTAYASGDHFQATGELGVVGVSPDYLGRGLRLVGLLADRDFGLLAWQPGWLLVLPAAAALPWLLPGRWPVLLVPLVTGWLTATFVALTMHGFWWPGRQLVVVLPLGVLAVACWLGRLTGAPRVWAVRVGAVLGSAGVATYGWVLAAGWAGRLTWVGAPDDSVPAVLGVARAVLPDYREPSGGTWWLHAAWTLALCGLAALGVLSGRRLTTDRHGSSDDLAARATTWSEDHVRAHRPTDSSRPTPCSGVPPDRPPAGVTCL